MTRRPPSDRLALVFLSAVLVVLSCRPASYEILRPGIAKKTKQTPNPEPVPPPDSRTSRPPLISSNVPPTARVEAIVNGHSVTRVQAGVPVMIRPSLDTVDPDDIGVSPCVNPGIVRADYEIDGGQAKTAVRPQGCESLTQPYVFPSEGRFTVSMVVTSNEDEKAFASMVMTVVKEGEPLVTADGGFTIAATPMLTPKNADVVFVGRCETRTKNNIKWDFGDGKTSVGVVVRHPYDAEGQFKVAAVCTDETGQEFKALVTIVVIDKKVDIPGVNPLPAPGGPSGEDDGGDADVSDTDGTGAPDGDGTSDSNGSGADAGGGGLDPGQKPGQNPADQKPGQRPDQRRVWRHH